MSNQIYQAFGLSPLIDNETGEIIEDIASTSTDIENVSDVDPSFEEASKDAEMVRNNIKQLIDDGFTLFNDVKEVAVSTQNAEQYQAAARFYSELIKANKELMNIHRDVFALKPPMPKVEETKSVTNVLITTNSEDFLDRVKAALDKKS